MKDVGHYTQGKPAHPIREALKLLMRKAPPPFVRGYDYSNLTDNQHDELQNWVGLNIPNAIYWSTAIGIIEAAEHIVEEAVANANIPPLPEKAKKKRMKKKAVRGFTLIELMVCLAFLGAIGFGALYGVFKWIGSRPSADYTARVQSWSQSMGYTYVNSTCQVFGIVSRCTVRVKEQAQPFSLDCNQASDQCSLTPMVQR